MGRNRQYVVANDFVVGFSPTSLHLRHWFTYILKPHLSYITYDIAPVYPRWMAKPVRRRSKENCKVECCPSYNDKPLGPYYFIKTTSKTFSLFRLCKNRHQTTPIFQNIEQLQNAETFKVLADCSELSQQVRWFFGMYASLSLFLCVSLYTVGYYGFASSVSQPFAFRILLHLLIYLSLSTTYSPLWLLYIPSDSYLCVFWSLILVVSFHSSLFLLYILHLTVQQTDLHNQFRSCNALPFSTVPPFCGS